MKKLFVILAMVALIAGASFAQGLYTDANSFQADVYSGNTSLTSSMLGTQVTPYSAGSKYGSDPVVPFLINFFVGWGIGSFVQGDTAGGVTALLGDILSEVALGVGYGLFATGNTGIGLGLIIGGGIGIFGFRLFEIIRPFTYAKKVSLSMNEFDLGSASLSLAPVINTVDSKYGITATFKL